MPFCDPRSTCFRYIILFLLCYVQFCLLFCIEIPSGLQGAIVRVFGINAKEYSLLFSIYSWPDIFLSLISGILIDRVVGLRVGFIAVTIITLIGEMVFTAGAFFNSFFTIVVGRFIMGCGSGSLKNLCTVFLVRWFKGKEVTFGVSLTFCSCRLGAASGLVLPQLLYERLKLPLLPPANYFRLGITFMFGLVAFITGLIACITAVIMDIRGAVFLDKAPFKRRKFNSRDFKDFSLKFWLTTSACAIFYAVLYSFVSNGQLYFVSKFGLSTKLANSANFLVFAAPVIVTPIVGILVEIIGFNVVWGVFGTVLGMLSHFLFNFANELLLWPYLVAILFSFAYSFFGTSIYPLPSFMVQDHQIATAYSLFSTQYSLLFTCISLVGGVFIDHAGYLWLEIYYFFLLYGVLSLLILVATMDFLYKEKRVNVAAFWLRRNIIELLKTRYSNEKISIKHLTSNP